MRSSKQRVFGQASAVSSLVKLAVVGLFTAGVGFGCNPAPDASETMHDADAPTRGTDAWMWKTVSDRDFVSVMGQLLGISSADYLPANHALTRRVQFWIDRLDAQIRNQHPEDLVNVAKPTAKIVRDGSANAFIAPVPVCYTLPVKVRPGTPNTANTVGQVFLDLETGGVSAWPAELSCFDAQESVATMRTLVDRLNASSIGCRLSVAANGQLVVGSDCEIGADLPGVVAARKVVVFQTANYVTVHTGLFPLMTESELSSVIAHELGHYYRSHSTAGGTDYNYFYTAQEQQVAGKPTPEPDRREFGEGAIMSSTLLNASDTYRSAANAVIRPELYFAAGSLVISACDAGGCSAACTEARTLLRSNGFAAAMGTYPFGAEANGEAQAYPGFQTKVQACLQTLSLATTPGTRTGTAVSWDVIKGAIMAPVWPAWTRQLPRSTQQALEQLASLAALRVGDDAPATSTAKAVVLAASRILEDQDGESVATLRRAVSERLAFYTMEQEADDIAAEWIAETGLDPVHVVEAMRRLGEGSPTSMRGMSLGADDCNELRARDWLDASGNYVFVPIGDYAEVHHSVCYRMFNLEREIQAHAHERADVQVPLMTSTQWAALQEAAADESEAAAPGGDLLRAHPMVRRLEVMTCPYATSYH